MLKKIVTNLFKTENRIPYAEVEVEGRLEIHPVYSTEIKNLITKAIYQETGCAPSKSEIDKLQATMAAEAFCNGAIKSVSIRTAKTTNAIEIDLNNGLGQCVSITKDGWCLAQPTSLFYRPSSSRALVAPVSGGSYELFRKHFKTKSDDDLKLIVGYMLSCQRPTGPYPVLVLQGEQGSAKSTTAKMIKTLIDPAIGITRATPKKEQDLFIAAKNNHLISFDNISLISNDLSDTLCRLATGGSFSCRTLYTNDDETLIELCKPVLLNGITDFVTRADLASRSIIIELATIAENERKSEEEVWRSFHEDLPLMLGVLMDGMVSAVKNIETTVLPRKPRMADVTLWCTAAEHGLKWSENSFLNAFEKNQLGAVLNNLSTDPVAISLRSFMQSLATEKWVGSASTLMNELSHHKPYLDTSRSWPATPTYLSGYLTRMAPNLRKVGIDFAGRERDSSARKLVLKKLANFNEMNPLQNEMALPMFDDDDSWVDASDADDASDARIS